MANKKILGLGIAAVLVVAGLFIFLVMGNDKMETSSNSGTGSDTSTQSSDPGIIGSTSSDNPETVEANEVTIKNFSFQPQKIQVKKGTTVTWTNQDDARHDVTPDNPSEDFKASELLAKGESYSFTFDKVGEYSYFCSPHPYMVGVVEVVEK